MWPDRVSNPGPLTYESDALSTALHGPARSVLKTDLDFWDVFLTKKLILQLHYTRLFYLSAAILDSSNPI